MSFASLSLNPALIQALPSHIDTPTEVQTLVIPELLSNKDLLALANTGGGKTLAYGLPLLHMLHNTNEQTSTQALVLVPTRELALQVDEALSGLAQTMGLTTLALCGGIDKTKQQHALNTPPSIIIATTGRLIDLLKEGCVNLSKVKHLILDEADRLLDMGFWPAVESITKQLPVTRQTALFSATFSDRLTQYATQIQTDAIRVAAHQQNSVNQQVAETLYLVNKGSKANALIALLTQHQWPQALVFIGAKENADKLTKKLVKAGIAASALHGNKTQQEREQTLAEFKSGKLSVLIATDLLARGVDINALPVVINFELPAHAEVYIHRVGRTARAGKQGKALSLVCHGETDALQAIRTLTQKELPLLDLEGFPVTDKPATGESKRAPRDKKANRRTNNKKSIKRFQGKPKRD